METKSNAIREKVKKKIMDAYKAEDPALQPQVAKIAERLYPRLNHGEQQQFAAALHDLSKNGWGTRRTTMKPRG